MKWSTSKIEYRCCFVERSSSGATAIMPITIASYSKQVFLCLLVIVGSDKKTIIEMIVHAIIFRLVGVMMM
jgi:hypothetical protein